MANSDSDPRAKQATRPHTPRRSRRGAVPAEPASGADGVALWDSFVIWDLGPGVSLATLPQLGVA